MGESAHHQLDDRKEEEKRHTATAMTETVAVAATKAEAENFCSPQASKNNIYYLRSWIISQWISTLFFLRSVSEQENSKTLFAAPGFGFHWRYSTENENNRKCGKSSRMMFITVHRDCWHKQTMCGLGSRMSIKRRAQAKQQKHKHTYINYALLLFDSAHVFTTHYIHCCFVYTVRIKKILIIFFLLSFSCYLVLRLSFLFRQCLALMSRDFLDLRIVTFFYVIQRISAACINFAAVWINPIVIEVNERGLASEQSFVWLNWVCGNGEMGS